MRWKCDRAAAVEARPAAPAPRAAGLRPVTILSPAVPQGGAFVSMVFDGFTFLVAPGDLGDDLLDCLVTAGSEN